MKRRLPVLETDWAELGRGGNTSWVRPCTVYITVLYCTVLYCTVLQVGPGHCSVVTTGDQWWMVYHAWVHGHTDQEPGRWETLDNAACSF